ncbi:hypothetical protein [Albirhodobacter sp. R86504]|uniref:hypothetical protein n=1 Tax=Albirhodobacter sp. R86504 TaxID=3093848 RepID=UPI0036733969
MPRLKQKRLFTPEPASLYPITIETVSIVSAALITAGEPMMTFRDADGRVRVMRAPIAGRILRVMIEVGDTLAAPVCAMTMREEPDLAPTAAAPPEQPLCDTPVAPAAHSALPRRSPYPWIRRNSGEHEAEAPHSRRIWAVLAVATMCLIAFAIFEAGMFGSPAIPVDHTTEQQRAR